MPVDPCGDALVRWFIRAALSTYAASVLLLSLLQSSADWTALSARGRVARLTWTLAFVLYAIHVALAFHYYHHWSHTDAVERTQQMSGFGAGIYISHAFTLLWGLDVFAWWLAPGWYAQRSVWIDRLLQGFMVFIIFHGAVVFAEGAVRWVSAVAAVGLLVWWSWCRWHHRRLPPVPSG
jgi:hypothetical protein